MNRAETKDRIKEALEIRGMKQVELVEKTGIDKGQMSSYLSGRYKPKQTNLNLIASALLVDEAWLMGYDVPMERNDNKKLPESSAQIISFFNRLNAYGKEIATEQVRLLTLDEKYTRPDNVIPITETPVPDYLEPNAAHRRTDLNKSEITPKLMQLDDDMMGDDF